MAVTVVLRHPRRHLLRRARHQLVAFWAGALLFVGLLSSAVAVATTFAVGGEIKGEESVTGQSATADEYPWPDVGLGVTLLVWGLSIVFAIVGIRYGLRGLRGRRRLVLFLRRFGHDDATTAVTFAAAKTVGGSWRLVTLDDDAIAPLGIPTGTRRFYGGGKRALELFPGVAAIFGKRVLPLTLAAMLAVVATALLRASDRRAALRDGTLDPYRDTVASLLKAQIPLHAIGWSLPGVFAFFAILLALELVAGFAVFSVFSAFALLLLIPLLPVLLFVSRTADAAGKADENTRHPIHVKKEIRPAADGVLRASRNIFAPRLVVLRVATPVWRQTVKGFAAVCSAPLIDLSDVSDNVLWEVEEMARMFGPKCLFVGRHDRVLWLAHPPTAGLGPNEQRLLRVLDGHEVLAYTTTRRGLRQFARSLRAKLLTASTLEPAHGTSRMEIFRPPRHAG